LVTLQFSQKVEDDCRLTAFVGSIFELLHTELKEANESAAYVTRFASLLFFRRN